MNTKTLLLLATLMMGPVASGQLKRMVCDETCRTEYQKTETTDKTTAKTTPKTTSKTTAKATAKTTAAKPEESASEPCYSVVSPVGNGTVEFISQSPRLSTLEGKTIAVVGISFMTGVTHPEIKRLLLENYPGCKVLLLDEIGYSGPYPAPGIQRKQKDEFERKLKEFGVDAVISGNGGCGLCTPKETGSCITAEYMGIPSVIIAGPGFSDQAKYIARNNGVPVMRVAEYPGGGYATVRIELPSNWDALMSELGYKPLDFFKL